MRSTLNGKRNVPVDSPTSFENIQEIEIYL